MIKYFCNQKFFFLIIFSFLTNALLAQELRGKVTGIKDGDTIEVLIDGKPVKVRLYGIDCPEKKQAFGDRAKRYTAILSFGKDVRIVPHGKDKYRRLLGEVFLPDHTSLNKSLIVSGMAWRYKYSKDKLLLELELKARDKKIGLWSDKHAIAPWKFRKIKADKSQR